MDQTKGSILVTPRSLSKEGHPALRALEVAGFSVRMPWPGKQPDEAQLLAELPACVGYLAGVEPVSEKVLQTAQNLKIISRNGVGIDSIDIKAADKLGILIKTTPGANSQGVAELALSLMLDGLRSITWSNTILKNGEWARKSGYEVQGKTLGLIGCGNIGRRLARLGIGIGMNILGYDLYRDETMMDLKGFRYVEIDELLTNSDVISLHCPPSEKPLLNKEAIASMRKGAVVVNTARASLVDNEAMLEALQSGWVATYATDVFEKEPPELDPLLLHEHVILTPHLGGFTKESVERATVAAVNNIIDFFKGNRYLAKEK